MVMEAPPSPQSVGREFVRQYYTLLNKAPTHLHRFYNNQSSFVHGGLDPPNRETSPVIGQKQIHQKIQQLNFRDCHAKITQVDSQATLGSGVVVQVTGELSNAGQPMRRFTQTFVLAMQSPKKYYVHNDIFRYQDEIISDEECDADARSDVEEDVVVPTGGVPERQVLDVQQQINSQPPLPPYYGGNQAPLPGQQPPPVQQQQQHLHSQPPPQHVLVQQQQVPVPTVNGAVHPDDLSVLAGQVAPNQPLGGGAPMPHVPLPQQQQQQQQPPTIQQLDEPQVPQHLEEPVEDVVQETGVYNDSLEPEQDQEIVTESSNEPKTWANLLKSNSEKTSLYSGNHPSLPPLSQPMRSGSPPTGNPGLGPRPYQNNRSQPPKGPFNPQQQQQQQPRVPRQDSARGGMPGRNMMYDEGLVGGEDRRRPQSMNFNNDANQLFLGNLPHAATEDDLRDLFSEYGTIVDLRVHSKPQSKIPPGARATPNYGFLTYESASCVQSCLQARPIYFPKGDPNGIPLNVEEKKLKEKQPYSNNRPSLDNRGGNRDPRDNNGPRRMGGPGGPNRPSMGGPGGPPNNGPNRSYNRTSGGGGPGGPPNRGGGPNNTYNNRR